MDNNLQNQVNSLQKEIDNLKHSYTIPRDVETALAERLNKVFSTTASLNFGNTLAQSTTDLTISLPQARLGDLVVLGVPNAAIVNGVFMAWVSAVGEITVRFANHSASASNPATGTFKVAVIKTT